MAIFPFTLPATFGGGGKPATVLALTPQPYYFRSQLSTNTTWVNLVWENQPTAAQDVANGAKAIDAALHSGLYTPPIIVFGHSMAAEAIDMWGRNYDPSSSISTDPSFVRFICAADPENPYTGITRVPHPPDPQPVYGNGVGWDSPRYKVTRIWRQYDEFADYPNRNNPNITAQINAAAFGFIVHLDYFDITLDPGDANNVSWIEGNTTFIFSRTRLPDESYRAEIERGYSRPSPLFGLTSTPGYPPPVAPRGPLIVTGNDLMWPCNR